MALVGVRHLRVLPHGMTAARDGRPCAPSSRTAATPSTAASASSHDPGAVIQEATGGTHGVLVTAVHPRAFDQALSVVRRGATRGEIHPTVHVERLDDINDVFERMEKGKIDGRIVLRH